MDPDGSTRLVRRPNLDFNPAAATSSPKKRKRVDDDDDDETQVIPSVSRTLSADTPIIDLASAASRCPGYAQKEADDCSF